MIYYLADAVVLDLSFAIWNKWLISHICGPVAAGKSTFAIELAMKKGALRITADEWVKNIFMTSERANIAEMNESELAIWSADKHLKCYKQVSTLCKQLLDLDIGIVLDGYSNTLSTRNKVRDLASKYNVEYRLFSIECCTEKRYARLENRNKALDQHSVYVSDEMFELMNSYFEPPDSSQEYDFESIVSS